MDNYGKANSSKTTQMLIGGLILVVAVFGLLSLGVINLPAGAISQQAQVDADVSPQNITCEKGTADAITFQVLRLSPDGAKADVTSDYNFDVRKDGVSVGTTTGATAINLSKLASYNVTGVDKDGTHDVYYFNKSFATGCEANEVIVLAEGVEDTALSTTIYSLAGGVETANSVGSPTTIGAGGKISGRVYVEATTANGAWSTANGGRQIGIAFDYNATSHKQPSITRVSDGSAGSAQSAPLSFTAVNATSGKEVFFIITSESLIDLGNIEIDFEVEPRLDTTNPADDSNIGITIFDKEGYLDASLGYSVGFENADDGTDIGESNVTDNFHVD
jgi:hypothetical protein